MSGTDATPEETPPETRAADRAPGRRKAVPERATRMSGGVPAPRYSRPAARPASKPPAAAAPVLPPAERPAARPARRRADPPRYGRGSDPLTDPYGIPAVSSAPHAPRHAAGRPPGQIDYTGEFPAITGEFPAVVEAKTATPAPVAAPRDGAGAPPQEPVATPEKPASPPVVPRDGAGAPPAEPQVETPGPEQKPKPEPKAKRSRPAPARARRRTEPRPTPVPVKPVAPKAPPRRTAVDVPSALNPSASRPERPQPQLRAEYEVPTITTTRTQAWVAALIVGALAVLAVRVQPDLPSQLRDVGSVLVSVTLAWGLAIRTGGRPYWATGLAGVLAVGAVVSDWQPLLAGAAVATGVLAATLPIMLTVPAATFGLAIREVTVATGIAWLGAFGVVGYTMNPKAEVDLDRFGYLVLALAMVGAFALVYRLGAGLHGLGRRGYVVAGGAVVMLALAIAYSEAIAQYGSRDIVSALDDVRASVRTNLGAVPHPILAVLGYPALLWGVFMRARRRQGWWVCAFGVAATAPSATRLVATDTGLQTVFLGALYSLLVGVAVGYLVIRVEQSFSGSHGRRARRDEEAVAHRPEPRRASPLH